jgi:hypothetical protein
MKTEKRLDVLEKQQQAEHQHLMASYRKELEVLRDSLNLSCEKFISVSARTEEQLSQFQTESIRNLSILSEKVVRYASLVDAHGQTLQDLHTQLQDFKNSYLSHTQNNQVVHDLEGRMNECTKHHLNSIQDLQQEFKGFFYSLKADLASFKGDTEQKLCDLIGLIKKNFTITKLDKEGLLKEIKVYEKTIFIIEKKIENIYTLIQRITKREESCPRLE